MTIQIEESALADIIENAVEKGIARALSLKTDNRNEWMTSEEIARELNCRPETVLRKVAAAGLSVHTKRKGKKIAIQRKWLPEIMTQSASK